jgi:hypothetical protein
MKTEEFFAENHLFFLAAAVMIYWALISSAAAEIYYVDSAQGDDNSSGTDISAPWKSLSKVNSSSFAAGDKILFKRGDVWNGVLEFSSSGTSGNPITIGAYGSGVRPVITVNSKFNGTWIRYEGNIWKIADLNFQPWRLRVEGEEKLQAVSMDEIDGVQYFWFIDTDDAPWEVTSADIYLYSESDPNTLLIELNTDRYAFALSSAHDVIVRDIEVQGGNDGCFSIRDGCSNVRLIHDAVGAYARFGITVSRSDHITIDSCLVDARFEFQYTVSSLRGPGDGITTWGNVQNLTVKNSIIRTWGHNCIYFHEGSKNGVTRYNSVHDCLLEGINSYSRAFETGGYANHNEFYNNIARNFTASSQVGGNYNIFHHNIFYNYTNSAVKDYPIGQVFTFQEFECGPDSNNRIEYNVFADIDEQALNYIAGGQWQGTIKNNSFKNNILYNVGKNPRSYSNKDVVIKLPDCDAVENENFSNNCIYNSSGSEYIIYRGTKLSVDEFNEQDGGKGDTIQDNIDDDPQFVNEDENNYHLSAGSPCIDAAIPAAGIDRDFDGNLIPYGDDPDIGAFEYSGSTGILLERDVRNSKNFEIIGGYPNPFNPETNIEFYIPRRGDVVFLIYNGVGQKVKMLYKGSFAKGVHSVRWDGTDGDGGIVSSGIYFAQLRFGGCCSTHKLLLLK